MRHSGNMGKAGKVSVAAAQAPQGGRKGPAGPSGPGSETKADVKGAQSMGASGGLSAAISHLKKC